MLDDIGFAVFKEYALSQDPTKMFTLLNYIFNKVLRYYNTFCRLTNYRMYYGHVCVQIG